MKHKLTQGVAVMSLDGRSHLLASAYLTGIVSISAHLLIDESNQAADVADVDKGVVVFEIENISTKSTPQVVKQ